MSTIREIKAFVRRDRIPTVLQALRDAGPCRCYVTDVHVHGAGVDPEEVRFSLAEEEAYMKKAKIEVLCEQKRLPDVLDAVRRAAATGHRGDGVVVVSPVQEIMSIRTGDRDALALL